MAKNCKNLKFILATIAANPGIKASEVQRLLMHRNNKVIQKGATLYYGWYFYQSWGNKTGIDHRYWLKSKGGPLTITQKGRNRLADFG